MTRPSPSTVTDEGLEPIRAALCANLRIEPVPNRMYDWRIEAESINEAASAVAEASGHTALLSEIEVLTSALERLDRNFDLLLAGKPVRDVAETKGEVRAALSRPLAERE